MKFAFASIFAAAIFGAGAAHAQSIVFVDPQGDDDGPGGYIYPVDPVFTKGSFDLDRVTISNRSGRVEFDVKMNAPLEDPWRMGVGYSVQMIFIFIDTDNVRGSGHTEGLPGLNVRFDRADAWDKVVVLSPQSQSRVTAEIKAKAPDLAADIIATRSKGVGRSISTSVPLGVLGGGDPASWGYQVVVQSNEGFPLGRDLLTRRVDEYEGRARFGGGNDSDCDPNVIDVLAGKAKGEASEVEAQRALLAYACKDDGTPLLTATLKMVRR